MISLLPADRFLHYAFDMWMARNNPHIPFEHYTHDIVYCCKSAAAAQVMRSAFGDRFAACKLELHSEKPKIAYCRDANRRGDYSHTSFDFPEFTLLAR